ncbi:dimethylsulfonioproprionate lyase family protein [Lutimaribacter marinistellae]|uniref:Dimethylsulfonioproprionate lyase family protein n=1 Tax=Lutimaribacter marinistellae TaxID=1820329 RepID=A0ABV7TG14_9RHOB
MSQPSFEALLEATRATHLASDALRDFVQWPDDLVPQAVIRHHIRAEDLLLADVALDCPEEYAPLRDAVLAAAPHAQWRETYKGTQLSQDFIERFGCYCLIGAGGAYASNKIGAYFVYMPSDLDYPLHHHPAEEVYFILAGEAEFWVEGDGAKVMRPGDHVFHASNVPHATRTLSRPLLALVLWRGDLGTKPVLTSAEPGV